MRSTSSFFNVISFFIFIGSTICTPAAAKSQPIPPFKITLSNNKIFSADNLPRGKPMILIYFDPDCDHCKNLMKDVFARINDFKRSEIVMVTFKSVPELIAFEKEHNTQKYSNIKVGTESTSFFLRYYYEITTLPFTALYDKKGNLNYFYRKETPVNDLVIRLKKIQ